ncbi:MAG: glutaredoxin domain-containing protein [Gammaproteobacteria bacterium]
MADTAVLYRMVTDDHVCPFGLKTRHLLRKHGYSVDDNKLTTRRRTEEFKQQEGVSTTPQTYIDGQRIGGYDDVRRFLGEAPEDADDNEEKTTYQPVVAVFATTLLMALAAVWAANDSLWTMRTVEWFIAFSMCVLAILKLRDLESFSLQFINYDLLAQRYVPYARFYPFAEVVAGILMIGGVALALAAPLALFIGTVGAISVAKAVYIDKRELRCACVGGNSRVPLGAISLTENLMMMGMGGWMLATRVLA